MSAQNPPRRGVLAAVLGTIGFSALAGILVAVMVTPALAVTSVAVKSGVGIFDNLPTYISIGKLPGPNIIYGVSGGQPVPIATIFDENRQEVAWKDISTWAKDAAVDGEDRRFYHHGGVDITGIARAALSGLGSSGSQQGASTISQQLVKNIFIQQAIQLPTEKEQTAALKAAQAFSLDRKLKEAKLAIALEKKYTKKQVLLAYLNIAPFGGTTYGIQAAAQRYYQEDASKLTIPQAASLMAIVQNPNTRAPINEAGYKSNKERRDVILDAMYAQKDITSAQLADAKKTPVDATTVKNVAPSQGCTAAVANTQFWCAYIKTLVKTLPALGATTTERAANWKIGGYKLYTTLDLGLQNAAQAVTNRYVPQTLPTMNIGSSTVSVEVGTGRILVMVQNKSFNETAGGGGATATAVNYSVDKANGGSAYGFQGGSTYKPFTLMNWLQSGHGLNEIVDATPQVQNLSNFKDSCGGPYGGTWKYRNDEGERGPYTVSRGTAQSVNGVFVNMGKQLDQCTTYKDATAFGVHQGNGQPPTHNPGAILGSNSVAPLTMAAAYAGIANGGLFCAPVAIDSVVTPDGKKEAGQPKTCSQALDPAVDAAVGVAMQGPFNSGTASGAKPKGVTVLGKTGTTDGSVQTWTVGSTTKVSTAVWIGNATGQAPTRGTRSGRACSAGSTVAVLRNCVFRDTVATINGQYPGGAFPTAAANYLNGSATPLGDYTGQTVTSATAQLTALGFTVTVGPAVASSQPTGTVASTNPGAGTRISKGYNIVISPSDGSLAKTMPNVVGENLNQAQHDISQSGFTSTPQTVCTVDVNPANNDKVTSTSPAGGASASPATAITIKYTKAICP
jgi:membrane peptidoglycan carboxypeptidase